MTAVTASHNAFTIVLLLVVAAMAFGCAQDKPGGQTQTTPDDGRHRFIVLDPGHFHAALVFKRAGYDGIASDVALYAPVSEDFNDHMARVIPFNTREDDPADWAYDIHLGPDWSEKAFSERKGDIAIFSGKNNRKIDLIKAAVDSGYNVLSDKPWLIDPAKYPVLEQVLDAAEKKGLIAYDIMTERHEITSILQRLLVAEESVFGTMTTGTPEDPAVIKSSIHHLSKKVAGRQLKRPWWFFDTSVQGEGLVDITTHLVDLVFWILHPDTPIDRDTDIEMVSAKRWPTLMTLEQYGKITQKDAFPPQFGTDAQGRYPYYCNGDAVFKLKGVNVKVEVIWNYEAPPGTGDTHYSIIKGSKAHVLILQDKEQNFKPELYVAPAKGVEYSALETALNAFFGGLASGDYPGLEVVGEKSNNRFRIKVPDTYRVGHEAHFGQVTDRFLELLGGEPMPEWEKANMLAKYYVTTKALEMAHQDK